MKNTIPRRHLQDACKSILGINFHALRHSFAKNLIAKNVSIATVAQLLDDDPQTAFEFYVGKFAQDDQIKNALKAIGN